MSHQKKQNKNKKCSCCCSVAQLCPTLCNPMDCIRPCFPVLYHLVELAQTHVHWVSDVIHPSHSLSSLLLLPSIIPSIRVFSSESTLCIRWPKYWSFSFSFSISLCNEYSGSVSFRIDWFDFLAVQGTLRSLCHQHSSKATVLWCSACFMDWLSNLYTTTGKTIALTIWTFTWEIIEIEKSERLSPQNLNFCTFVFWWIEEMGNLLVSRDLSNNIFSSLPYRSG